MVSGKKEIETPSTDSKICKKSRVKKLVYWLIIDFIVAVAVFGLLKYRPGRYQPLDVGFSSSESGQVSPYLTHKLSPEIYNGAQRGEPFEIIVTQDGINDIISRANWPIYSEGVLLYSPAALFIPGTVVLMGTADVKGVELVITIELEPKILENGLLNLHVTKVKVGAMNITPLARVVAKKMYAEQFAAVFIDTKAVQAKIAASLLKDVPFEPVFKIDGKKVRIDSITVGQGELMIRFVPVPRRIL